MIEHHTEEQFDVKSSKINVKNEVMTSNK